MASASSIIVIKIGGSTLGGEDTSLADVVTLRRQGMQPVVVHGGGPAITDWMGRLGVRAEFVEGLRATDEASLEVVTAVLAGLINKRLVADILALGGPAVGISGADGAMLQGIVERPSLGFVATQMEVDPRPIRALTDAEYIPVIAPLAVQRSNSAQLLNVNADTAAGAIAVALGAARLVFLTDVDGVLDGNGRLIQRISSQQAQGFLGSGVAKGGMIPKVEASLHAASHGTPSSIVNATQASVLVDCLGGATVGTSIR